MHLQPSELEQRTDRFAEQLRDLLKRAGDTVSATKVTKALLADSTAMQRGYREACASSSPEQFIERIAHVVRKAMSRGKRSWKRERSRRSSQRRATPPSGATADGWFHGEIPLSAPRARQMENLPGGARIRLG